MMRIVGRVERLGDGNGKFFVSDEIYSLHVLPQDTFAWKDKYIAAFHCRLEGHAYFDCVRMEHGVLSEVGQERTILAFSIEEMGSSSFYNGYTYVDTMKREATKRFLELTHEKYKKNIAGID